METSYDLLFELLKHEQDEQPKEFKEVISYVNYEKNDADICDLVTQLYKKEVQYTTYSHA